ncbi:MAG: hypothetical protein RR497_05185 [Oscillospiraceae bacterium]
MFKKMQLKKEIKELTKEIEVIEAKRSRSQSALVLAILEQKDADEKDVEYFNTYTAQINQARDTLHMKKKELENM